MLQSILKILAGIFDIPRLIEQIKAWRQAKKIDELVLENAKIHATIEAEKIHQEVGQTHEENVEEIKNDAESKDLGSIADYFNQS